MIITLIRLYKELLLWVCTASFCHCLVIPKMVAIYISTIPFKTHSIPYFSRLQITLSNFNRKLGLINFLFLDKLLVRLSWLHWLKQYIHSYFLVFFEYALIGFYHVISRSCCPNLESDIWLGNVFDSEVGHHFVAWLV